MDVKATIVATLLAVFIGQIPLSENLVPASHAGEKGTFSGSWVANGSKEILPLGKNRETALFKLSGHVNLKDNKIGKEAGFLGQLHRPCRFLDRQRHSLCLAEFGRRGNLFDPARHPDGERKPRHRQYCRRHRVIGRHHRISAFHLVLDVVCAGK